MRQKVFILIIFVLSSIFSNAQGGTIFGAVIDSRDQSPIEFATVTLFNESDSTLVSGTVTDSTGAFVIKGIPGGNYYIKFNFIGFNPLFLNDQQISIETPVINLETISLVVSDELATVQVTGEKSLMETKIDKRVFNADQSITSKGGTALDLMRQIPSITVDQNDNILLRGDANVTILMDGRPLSMPANQLLKQIPASAVEKVEIITNPSAKYDPEGMSGIINIILKKNKFEGFNGSVSSTFGYGIFPKVNGTGSINYRNDKINAFGNYSYDYRQIWFGGWQERDVLLGDTTWDRLRQDDYGERINTSHYGRAGIDYFLNDHNTLYFSGTMVKGQNFGSREVNYNNVNDNNEVLYSSTRDGQIVAPSTNYVANAGWQKSFSKEGHTLDLDANFSQTSMHADEDLQHVYFDENQSPYLTNYQHTIDANKNATLISKIDYVLPINDSTMFEAGFHYTNRFSDGSFYSESAGEDGQFSDDQELNNIFRYQQNTFAPYSTFGMQIGNFGFKAGIRVEQTMTEANLVNTNQTFINDYLEIFPSTHLSYKFSNYTEIQLSYSKRINRPEMFQLNPFTNFSDPLTLQTGNPFLRPEIIHVNEVSFLKYWNKFNINVTGYYRMITDLIRRDLSNEGAYSTVSYANLGKSHLSGGDLTMVYTPIKGVRIMSNTNFWNTSTKDEEITGGEMRHYMGISTSLQATYQHKKGWTFQLWSSYQPTMNVLQGYILPNYGGGFAVQKSLFDNKGSISLSAVDILKSRQFTFESYDLDNYTFDTQRRWESRSFYLTFQYNFGKMGPSKRKRRSGSNSSEDDINIPDMQ